MQKPLAIKPSDESQSYINAIGGLLNKTLPENWEMAQIYVEKNNNIIEWKGLYSLKDTEKIPFKINTDFIANLKKLRCDHKYICPVSMITFHSNHRYKIDYEHTILPNQLTLNEVQEKIVKLKEINLENSDIDSLKKYIQDITKGYEIHSPIIPVGTRFSRGVKYADKPVNTNKLTYPPKNRVTGFHRAGRINQPLFYCSTNRDAVFYELSVKTGEKIAISQWETTASLLVNNVGYYPDTLRGLGSNRECPYWSNVNQPEGTKKINMLVGQLLADEFTKIVPLGQEHLYKISIAIAEQHFQQDIFDGLMYPAIAMKGNADNFAFKPKSVDDKLILRKVEYIEVKESHNDSEYEISILDFANSFTSDGKVEWKGRCPHWVLRKKGDILKVTVENSKWVARNIKGDLVEPE